MICKHTLLLVWTVVPSLADNLKVSLPSTFYFHSDHYGVSNKQMALEYPNMAERYQGKSVAEQNSLDVALDLFMSDHFEQLRDYVFPFEEDMARFRQVTVNVLLATDIFDPELNELRKQRWAKAFDDSASLTPHVNACRATVVLESIMQAADVCHTMQHWHIYQRFNKRLFQEMLTAYRNGRFAVNPAMFWYKGKLSFFDNYVIPLAQKLNDCRVFGASSDECLNYALRNRGEWETCGKGIVEEYVEEFGLEVDKGE
jgi:hypothetical protein